MGEGDIKNGLTNSDVFHGWPLRKFFYFDIPLKTRFLNFAFIFFRKFFYFYFLFYFFLRNSFTFISFYVPSQSSRNIKIKEIPDEIKEFAQYSKTKKRSY